MYQKQTGSIIKHLDFLLLDFIVMEVSFILAYIEHAPIGHTHAVNEALLHRLQLALQRLESKGAEEE